MITTDFKVKTVDCASPDFAEQFHQSLKHTGFASLVNHGIELNLVRDTLKEWETFFESGEKFDYLYNREDYLGFYPMGTENAKGYSKKNHLEYFHYREGGVLPEKTKANTEKIFRQFMTFGKYLLKRLEKTLPQNVQKAFPKPLSEMMTEGPHTVLRILHYPPLESEGGDPILGAEHEDLSLVSQLVGATAPGLQVKDRTGEWHDVPYDSEALVVNVGDTFQKLTKGYLKSTTHRVMAFERFKGHRYSIPCFICVQKDLKISEDQTAEEFFQERMRENGLS
jgi:hypothetical protein